jgi:phenylpropionate dioxygenase-like ring-hydroxylating dioxygenase large terminal subunit
MTTDTAPADVPVAPANGVPAATQMAMSPGVSYQELLDTDTHPVPAVLREQATVFQGYDDFSSDRFSSRGWHELEVEHLWGRVWQFACREEQLSHVGSYVVYDIASLSFIIVRTEEGLRAYYNACLHRGRQLKDHDGRCDEFRCPFHGFTWNLEGRLARIPANWDFPQVKAKDWRLPEAQVATWGGFVFINPDPDAEPLESFLGELPAHFERWDLANRYVSAHVSKVVRANWKIVQEAFCESYHVNATHPQAVPYLGDVNSQIDIWDNVSRVITPGGTPSPLMREQPTEQDILRYMLDTRVDEDAFVQIPEGSNARTASAAAARERWRKVVGDQVDTWSDAEFIDNLDYSVFPNFHPWGAYNRIVYRFRPNGDEHESAIMDVFFLSPFAGERPAPASTTYLGPDESFVTATELGLLAKVFDQDACNMPMVHKGIKQSAKQTFTLSAYQEGKLRWFHRKLDKWLGVAPCRG